MHRAVSSSLSFGLSVYVPLLPTSLLSDAVTFHFETGNSAPERTCTSLSMCLRRRTGDRGPPRNHRTGSAGRVPPRDTGGNRFQKADSVQAGFYAPAVSSPCDGVPANTALSADHGADRNPSGGVHSLWWFPAPARRTPCSRRLENTAGPQTFPTRIRDGHTGFASPCSPAGSSAASCATPDSDSVAGPPTRPTDCSAR